MATIVESVKDMVNHPSHYAEGCSMECIDVMEMIFGKSNLAQYCLVNMFKYLWRWEFKNGKEDIEKAEWYFKRYKALNINYSDGNIANKLEQMLEEAKTKIREKNNGF